MNWYRHRVLNIACLAVDGNGEIIDFDFNDNGLVSQQCRARGMTHWRVAV